MKTLLLFLVVLISQLPAKAQITLVDFVRIKNNHRNEALYFYENNWKLYRDEAVKRGVIQSYQLLSAPADSVANFHLMLVTVYKDSAQYLASEASFEPILKMLRPNGPVLLNELKPADFRENVFYKAAATVFAAEQESYEPTATEEKKGAVTYDSLGITITQNATYLMPGDELILSINSSASPVYKVMSLKVGGSSVSFYKPGKAEWKTAAGSLGKHMLPVEVQYEDATGKFYSKTFSINYMVGQANVFIVADRMNLLYIGVDNPVSIATSLASDLRLSISVFGGGSTIRRVGPGQYMVQVKGVTDTCQIFVSANGKLVAGAQFRTRHLPVPVATVGGFMSGDTIKANAFLSQPGISTYLKDFPFEVRNQISKYTVSVRTENGFQKTVNVTSAPFSAETKQLFKDHLKPGAAVTISNILVYSPDGRQVKLQPVIYHIR